MAILDTYSAAAAYSLRKVRTAYTGSAVRVRRNGDQAELDIGFSGYNLDETALINHTGDANTENLMQYSEELSNGYYGTSNVSVTADNTTAPDGTTTAELLTESATAGVHVLYRQITTSGTLCLSVYLKAGTRRYVNIAAEFNAFAAWMCVDTVNWTSNTGTAGGASISSPTITSVGNGWYRCSFIFSGVANPYCQLIGSDVANPSVFNPTYTGNSSTWYAWGFQLNTTSLKTYRRTTTEAVTSGGLGYVTTWYDQSGNGLDFTQTTAANQPRIVNNGVIEKINNRPMLYLSGNMHMGRTNVGIMRNKTHGCIFTIARFTSTGSENRLLAFTTNSTASSRVLFGAGATANKFFAAGRRLDGDTYSSTSGTATVDNNALARLSAIYKWTSSDLELYVNGTQDVNNTSFQTDGSTSDTDSAEMRLGIMNFSNLFTGYVPEILIYNTDESANRSTIETNIDNYYIQGIDESTGSPRTYIYFLD